ncbi:MAG: hypothetical protein A2W80_12935 [Candidatus Riflebacteria bacterium GWC2_50_8]|nr:MAG: hypothetical protein A2W80_12935 [Candidatus Riflebacteria bacterium GWC2_50_8]
MNKALIILAVMATLLTGCDIEFASDIEEETLRIEQDVEALMRLKAQLPTLEEEINGLREQAIQKSRELEEFRKNHPDVVEFAIQQNQ